MMSFLKKNKKIPFKTNAKSHSQKPQPDHKATATRIKIQLSQILQERYLDT